MNKLVSIIVPCYNGEKYVPRFLDSVLVQTYYNIELIIINDGSTDETETVLNSYKERFFEKNIKYIIINQENKGPAEAINQGLKIFKGDYLMWVDCDDILKPRNVEYKVSFLEKNTDCGWVISGISIVNENDINEELQVFKRKKPKGKDTIFEDLIKGENVCYMGAYMLRSQCFLDVNPNRSIPSPREVGQNFQLLLPISYKYKAGYLDEVLYTYVKRSDSRSRLLTSSFEKSIKRITVSTKMLEDIIKSMKIPDEDYYIKSIKWRYIQQLMKISIKYKNLPLLAEQIKKLRENNMLTLRDSLLYWKERFLIINFFWLAYRKIKRICNKIIYYIY